jgi:hypothetical protein
VSALSEEWRMVRHLLACRSGHRCECCGRLLGAESEGSAHHRLPQGRGGTSALDPHRLDRLALLCGGSYGGVLGCHGLVESEREAAYECGLLLRHPESLERVPEVLATPMVLWSGRVVVLDDLAPGYLAPPGGRRYDVPLLDRVASLR